MSWAADGQDGNELHLGKITPIFTPHLMQYHIQYVKMYSNISSMINEMDVNWSCVLPATNKIASNAVFRATISQSFATRNCYTKNIVAVLLFENRV